MKREQGKKKRVGNMKKDQNDFLCREKKLVDVGGTFVVYCVQSKRADESEEEEVGNTMVEYIYIYTMALIGKIRLLYGK